MSGQWSPEWDDTEPGFPGEAGSRQDPDLEARLPEVSSALAAVPVPALPDVFEARISAAIAAEAAARAAAGTTPGEATAPSGTTPSGPVLSRAPRPARSRSRSLRGWRFRAVLAAGSALACLVLAIIGYALAGRATTTTGPEAASSRPTAAAGAVQNGSSSAVPFNEPQPDHEAHQAGGVNAGFVIIESGTKYAPATLTSQVRKELVKPSTALSPSTPSAAGSAVPAAIVACVLHLTGNVAPSLVDRASYAGRPAYVIAVPSRVWVVGLGCTAAHPQLITSASLAGLPSGYGRGTGGGNLRALGSVER